MQRLQLMEMNLAGPNVESAVAQPYLPYQRKYLKRTSKTAVSWRTTKRKSSKDNRRGKRKNYQSITLECVKSTLFCSQSL